MASRSAAFAPTTSPGVVSTMILNAYPTDALFKAGVKAQFEKIESSYTGPTVNQDVEDFLADASSVPSGPVAFMLVTQPAFGGAPAIRVGHAVRTYKLSQLDPPNSDPTLINKTFLFAGEITQTGGYTQLPEVLSQPPDSAAFAVAMLPTNFKVPKWDLLQTAFAAQDANNGGHKQQNVFTWPRATASSSAFQLPRVLPIPIQFIPNLIDQPSPRVALERVVLMENEFEEDDDKALFARTLAYLRAACVSTGGTSTVKDLSRMASAWYPPNQQSPLFKRWTLRMMKSLYPEGFGPAAFVPSAIPPAGLPPAPAPAPTPAFTLDDYVKAANEVVDHHRAALAASTPVPPPPAPAKDESGFSRMTKEAIIRGHGLPDTTLWTSSEIADVWYRYSQEMKNAASKDSAIQRVFNDTDAGSSLDVGECIHPKLSSACARHIRSGTLAISPVSYETCDVGFVPLAFMERTTAEISMDDFDAAEYEGVTHRTIDTERARSSRSKAKKAPKDYSSSVSLLRSYASVIKQHFTRYSPAYLAIDRLFRAMTSARNTWINVDDPASFARLWWKITKEFSEFFASTAWEADGAAPTLDIRSLVEQIKAGVIFQAVDFPRQLVPTSLTPRSHAADAGGGGTTAGGRVPPPEAHLNQDGSGSRVHPDVKALLDQALPALGRTAKFGTILSRCRLESRPNYGQVILDNDQCQEFLTVGSCTNSSCHRAHTVGFTPAAARLQNFITRVTPVVNWIVNATEEELQSSRAQRRRQV